MNQEEAERLNYLHTGLVRAIRLAAKRKGLRVVWGPDNAIRVYCPSGRVVVAHHADSARELLKAIESGEVA